MTPLDASPWAAARWLVLAPHPDDETLGAGALIADAARADRLAGVAFLTDGAGSHPAGTPRVSIVRQAEAATAIHRLAGRRIAPTWIGWPDANPPELSAPRYARDVARFAALLRRSQVDAIAVTAANEPHCDHAAAYRFAAAAIARSRRRVALFAYHVWSDPPAAAGFRTRAIASGRRRHALQAHRSQLTGSMGPGFRLPRERCRMAVHDTLYLQRRAR